MYSSNGSDNLNAVKCSILCSFPFISYAKRLPQAKGAIAAKAALL